MRDVRTTAEKDAELFRPHHPRLYNKPLYRRRVSNIPKNTTCNRILRYAEVTLPPRTGRCKRFLWNL